MKIDIDLGSREFSLLTGKQFVNERYTLSADVAGFSFGLDASRNVEIHQFTYGRDSISNALSGQLFDIRPAVEIPWGISAKEFWKIEFGVSAGLGFKATLDFRNFFGQ